jgi:hypothetical protein
MMDVTVACRGCGSVGYSGTHCPDCGLSRDFVLAHFLLGVLVIMGMITAAFLFLSVVL